MASSQVNRPTNVRDRDADINRKLQIYGIATAFKNGKVPSNEQIDIALNSFMASRALSNPSIRLSAEGRGLVLDFRKVVDQAKTLILNKNDGNLLQDFIWQAQQIESGTPIHPGTPVTGTAERQRGNEALEGLRTLGTLLVTNGQFRKLLNDATVLIRDIAGDVASKAAAKVQPSDEQLSQIDQPADENTWHGVPDMSGAKLKDQIKSTYSKIKPVSGGDLRDAAAAASSSANAGGSSDPADNADLVKQQGASAVDARAGAQAGAATLKQRVSENVPEETKEQARTRKEQAQNYLSKKMPQERRDQTIWRLRKMVIEIQGHPDYKKAVDTLLSLAETYVGHAGAMGKQSAASVRDVHTNAALKLAEADLKLLIERFANGTASDDLIESINTIYRDADKDPDLRAWFKHLDDYVRKCLQQQGFIMQDRATEEWNKIYDRGNYLLRERYRNHTNRIADEVKFLGGQFDEDPLNQRFRHSVQKLFKDLTTDESGRPAFKPHLVKDLTEVIIPGALRSLHYVPIPRIEFSDPTYDAVIENLIIESDNLMPNIIEIANDNYFRFGRKQIANKNANSVSIHVSGIQMDLRDVSYYVKRKQGSAKLTDEGIMDIFLGGSGFSFKMKLSKAHTTDRQNFFKVDKVDVDVKNFKIKLKKSKFKTLFRLVKPVMLRFIRPILQKVLEKQIKDQFNKLDTMAYEIKREADRAKSEVRENPEDTPNIYQRYATAAQKKIMQGKKKTENVASNTQVIVAITQHDSIFPNIQLPGGISSKATEYKELAKRGEKWESPIFLLGSAPPTAGLTGPLPVVRRNHGMRPGSVRGAKESAGLAAPTAPAPTGPTPTGPKPTGPRTTGQAIAAAVSEPTRFRNEVDQAFGTAGTSATGTATGAGGATTDAAAPTDTGRTLLGAQNPVLRGDV